MNTRQSQHHQALTEINREYARIRAGLVRSREDALLQVMNIACLIELVDQEALEVFEALRDLEGDEEIVAS